MNIFGGSKRSSASLSVALLIACQVPLVYTSAFAQSVPSAAATTRNYDIPAAQLDRVLVAVAAASRRPISFDAGLTSNYRSAGVKGNLTVEQAIDKALLGTGLERATTASGALTIREKSGGTPPAVAQDGAGAAVLPQITVRDSATKQDVTSFTAANSSSATLNDTPMSETPMAVQVITQGTMRSQQATSVQDVLRNVSGVTVNPGQAAQETVSIRGFTAPVSTDGLLTNNSNSVSTQGGLDIPIIGVERIDVVKGADSIISGGTNPGGVVNVVRKQPQAEPVYEVQAQTGSYGEMLLGADAGGVISQNNNLNYRFIVSGERTSETYGGSVGMRSLYLAPSIGYQTANTNLVVGFEQNTQHTPLPYYTVLVNGAPTHLNYPIGNADDHFRVNSSTLYYDFTQHLSPNWSIKSKGSYNATVTSLFDTAGKPYDDLGDVLFLPVAASIHQRAWSFQEIVEGKFATGPVAHDVVAGFNYQKTLISNAGGIDAAGISVGTIYTPITFEDAFPATTSSEQDSYSNQFYLQDQARFERIHVLASISHGQAWTPSATGTNTDGVWSPNVGVLYQLTGDIAAYASYQKTFTPQGGALLLGGGVAPPSLGKNVEVGVKGNFLSDKLTASVALFRAAATNVVIADSNEPGFNTLDPSGFVTRGVELDVSGQITNGLKVTANYTYNAQQSTPQAGQVTPSEEARHKFFFWAEYAFQAAPLQGFGVGGGITVRSSYAGGQDKFGDPFFRVPGQASTDLSVFYRTRRWTTTFGVKNVFNHTQYGESATNTFVPILPGRTFLLTSIYQF